MLIYLAVNWFKATNTDWRSSGSRTNRLQTEEATSSLKGLVKRHYKLQYKHKNEVETLPAKLVSQQNMTFYPEGSFRSWKIKVSEALKILPPEPTTVLMLDYGFILIPNICTKLHLRRAGRWWRCCCWGSPRSRPHWCSKWLRSGAPPRCRRCRCWSRTGSGRHVPPVGPRRPRPRNWPPTSPSPGCCDTARWPARCWAGRALRAQQGRRVEIQLRWMASLWSEWWTKVSGNLH